MRQRKLFPAHCLTIGLCTLFLMFLMQCAFFNSSLSVYADDASVKIWEYGEEEHRINKIIGVGGSTGAIIGYKVDGISEQSHTWSIDDPNICQLEEASDGKISLIGIGEGLTRLRLSVKASDNKTYTDYTVISVYTSVESANGVTNKVTTATRSAHSGKENSNERASLPKGTKLSVYGKCGSYYRATVDYEFTDGRKTKNAFVAIADIDIPVTGIALDQSEVRTEPGANIKLNATITPALATNKNIKWTSDSKSVATVDKNGNVKVKKSGTATITAETDDGGHKAKCKIYVTSTMPQAAAKPKAKKPTLTGHATSSTSVKLKVKGGSKTAKNCKICIDGEKLDFKTCTVYINNKKIKKNSFTLKKNRIYTIKIKGLPKNDYYEYKVGKSKYYSNEIGIETGISLLTIKTDSNKMYNKLKWTALSDSNGYEIYRGFSESEVKKSKKPYKIIKSKQKTQFVDKKIKKGKLYYYCVKGRKNGHKSEVVKGGVADAEKNMELARQSSLFENVAINNEAGWDANTYSINGGEHPYVKYRFTGDKLEIHLYVDFVQYIPKSDNSDGSYYIKIEDPQEVQNGELCINTFIKGLIKGYDDIYIDPKSGDFDNSVGVFTLKIKVHRARTETFSPGQRFVEVRIGGVAPMFTSLSWDKHSSSKSDSWFHQSNYEFATGVYERYIYMPMNVQLATNTNPKKTNPFNIDNYMCTAAHETGHTLGLDDAYADPVDRCATNGETCLKLKTEYEDEPYEYHNLMKNSHDNKGQIRPNDVEMMLLAYKYVCSTDLIMLFEHYKNYSGYLISDAIKNKEDEYDEAKNKPIYK